MMSDCKNVDNLQAGAITEWVVEWSKGNPEALDRLIPLVFDDLRRMARGLLTKDGTLQPTAAVNELFIKLHAGEPGKLSNSKRFFGFAGRVLRNLVIDDYKRHKRQKRGGAAERVPLDWLGGVIDRKGFAPETAVAVGEAFDELARTDPQLCMVLDLWLFAGYTVEETAKAVELNPSKVKRERSIGRKWLARKLGGV